MQKLNTILKKTTGLTQNKRNPTVQLDSKKSSTPTASNKVIDLVLQDHQEVLNPQFTAWYAKTIRIIGVELFVILAKTAKADGNDPARLMSHLIKQELNNG